MSELMGIYAIWYREFKVFLRERSRVIGSIVTPIMWLVVFGGGLGSSVSISGVGYQTFIYPGILIMSVIFSSIFFGVYIVWDRKIDFLKEVLVAPITRISMFIGKVLGGATDSMIQSMLLLGVGVLLMGMGVISGISLNAFTVLATLGILFIATVGAVSIGLIIGSLMESPQGFQLVGSFLIFPLFFLSGALFPIDNLPAWLAPLNAMDPFTYSVDAVRGVLIGANHFSLAMDLAVASVFSIVMIFIGSYAFKKMKI